MDSIYRVPPNYAKGYLNLCLIVVLIVKERGFVATEYILLLTGNRWSNSNTTSTRAALIKSRK